MEKVYRVNGKIVDCLTYIRNDFQKGFRNSDYNLQKLEKLSEQANDLWFRIANEFNYSNTPERFEVEDKHDLIMKKIRKIENLPYSHAWEDRRMRQNYGEHYSGFEFNFELSDDEFLIEYGLEKRDF